MRPLLTHEEKERLARQIAEAESKTAGEMVVVVLHKSASYGAYRVAFAGMAALLLAGAAHLFWPELTAMQLLGAQAILAAPLYLLLGWPLLLRSVTPREVLRSSVSDRIKQLFIERGVTETRDRSGVLVLLSALERRVEILGDRGIHEHLGQDVWQSLVTELAAAIRGGKVADGLSKIIERLGRELSARFPARPDDTDELPNRIVTEDD